MRYNIEYSANEMLLFKHYRVDDICQQIMPHDLYRMMAEKAFLANEQSEYADALRRGLEAMKSCFPYRLTPEFDKLIDVSGL